MTKWFPINKVPPPDGISVLTWDGEKRCIDLFENGVSQNKQMSDYVAQLIEPNEEPLQVTHWTYMPNPPTEK